MIWLIKAMKAGYLSKADDDEIVNYMYEIDPKFTKELEDRTLTDAERSIFSLALFKSMHPKKTKSVKELAEACNVSKATVYNLAKKLGHTPTEEEIRNRKNL